MTKALHSAPTNTRPLHAVETPYMRAKQEWDDRLGAAHVQAKNWRVACIGSLIVACGTIATSIILATGRTVVPVFVGLDRETGKPAVIGDAAQHGLTPGALEIKYFLSEFIKLVRGLPLDPVLVRQNWVKGYAFTRKGAANLLNKLSTAEFQNGTRQVGKAVVSVQPISVVQIPDTQSYQVRWKESVYTTDGQKTDEYTMLGTFQIELEPPQDAQALEVNPLGLFVKSFSWNREL